MLVVAKLVDRLDGDTPSGVLRDDLNRPIVSGRELDMSAEADGRVERLRAVMEEIKGPDVDGAAGQIDSRRSRRRDAHATL